MMRALTWQGKRKVSVDEVEDPRIEYDTDAIVKITSTAICGSDLHLYELFGPFIDPGTSWATSPWARSSRSAATSRAWRSATASWCPSTSRAASASCAPTVCSPSARPPRYREYGSGAALFGYTKLYGQIPGGQAEYLRVPLARLQPHPDRQRAARRALPVPQRHPAHGLARGEVRRRARWRHAGRHGTRSRRTVRRSRRGSPRLPRARRRPGGRPARDGRAPRRRDVRSHRTTSSSELRDLTDGRGVDSVVDAVGMEAHGNTGVQVSPRMPSASCRIRGPSADAEHGPRPAGGAATPRSTPSAGRHRLPQRRLRGRSRHPAHEDHVRQAGDPADGAVQRQAVDGRPRSARRRPRRPARGHGPDDARTPARGGARRCTRSSRRRKTAASRSS